MNESGDTHSSKNTITTMADGFADKEIPARQQVEGSSHELETERLLRYVAEALAAEQAKGSNLTGSEFVQVGAALLGLLGVGLYGALRFGQQLFCRALGVEPEEIGLTYASTVSRAAVIVVALASVVLAVYTSMLFIGGMLETVSPRLPFSQRVLPIAHLVLTIAVGLAALFYLQHLMGEEAALLVAGFFVTVGILYWTARGAAKLGRLSHTRRPSHAGEQLDIDEDALAARDKRIEERQKERRKLVRSPLTMLMVGSLVIMTAFLLAGEVATRAAQRVQNGSTITADSGLGLLGLRAERVSIIGDRADKLKLSDKDILLLGQANGYIVFYDLQTQKPIRVPSDLALFEL